MTPRDPRRVVALAYDRCAPSSSGSLLKSLLSRGRNFRLNGTSFQSALWSRARFGRWAASRYKVVRVFMPCGKRHNRYSGMEGYGRTAASNAEAGTPSGVRSWSASGVDLFRRLCSGAAGLLDGKRVTTHWRYADRLTARFPNIHVEPDVLYVDEGNILTSAGARPESTSVSISCAATTEPISRTWSHAAWSCRLIERWPGTVRASSNPH